MDITIGGLKMRVASLEECARAKYIVCGPAPSFADDVCTFCALCARVIYHRPYQPAAPQKICHHCFIRLNTH